MDAEKQFKNGTHPKNWMKRIRFFAVWVALFCASVDVYGQELFVKKDKKGRYGIVDQKEKIVKPYKYGTCKVGEYKYLNGKLAEVTFYIRTGFIDKNNRIVVIPKYHDAINFSNELVQVSLTSKYGFIDATGKEVIPVIYNSVSMQGDIIRAELVDAKMIRRYEYFNKTGQQFSRMYDVKEGLRGVQLNGKWGFIDKNGNEVIPLKYEGAESFSEGLAVVKFKGKWGVVDRNDLQVVPFKYDIAFSFFKGLARVRLNGKQGLIDITGKEVIPCKYDEVPDNFYGEIVRVKLNGKYGYVNKNGKEIAPCKYDEVPHMFDGDIVKVKLGGKFDRIELTGNLGYALGGLGGFVYGATFGIKAGQGILFSELLATSGSHWDDYYGPNNERLSHNSVNVVFGYKFGFGNRR